MTIPAEICRGFGIKAGDYLMITATDNEFLVKKVRK
jgi:AbrB family looped-hinge helix DNA binding protein